MKKSARLVKLLEENQELINGSHAILRAASDAPGDKTAFLALFNMQVLQLNTLEYVTELLDQEQGDQPGLITRLFRKLF